MSDREVELPSCPACGHPHLHRSAPKARRERLLVALTPVRYFRCHACMHRGWTAGAVSRGELEEQAALRQLRARRLASAAGWALAAGVALAATIGIALAS